MQTRPTATPSTSCAAAQTGHDTGSPKPRRDEQPWRAQKKTTAGPYAQRRRREGLPRRERRRARDTHQKRGSVFRDWSACPTQGAFTSARPFLSLPLLPRTKTKQPHAQMRQPSEMMTTYRKTRTRTTQSLEAPSQCRLGPVRRQKHSLQLGDNGSGSRRWTGTSTWGGARTSTHGDACCRASPPRIAWEARVMRSHVPITWAWLADFRISPDRMQGNGQSCCVIRSQTLIKRSDCNHTWATWH